MGSVSQENAGAEENSEFIPKNAVDISPKKDGGVLKVVTREGTGDITPPNGCKVIVHYEGKLTDGTVFDSSKDRSPFDFTLGKGTVIKAWDIGVATMKKGEVATLVCREDYAYGAAGSPPKIPPKATLIFEIEMIDWEPENLSGKKDKGILRTPITEGVGFDSPKETANVQIHLKGEYQGRVFDDRDVSFCLGEGAEYDVPVGVEKALEKFIKGETSKLELKHQYAFGALGSKKFDIPGSADVVYTVTLKDFDQVEDAWMMSSSKKIEEAKRLKEKGANYFKADKYNLAFKMYNRMVELLEYKSGFEGEEKPEADSLLLAANLNISLCHLRQKNYTAARNTCNKVLDEDKNNVKALFRRGQALLGLGEPQLAKEDFERLLKIEPENKAVPGQISLCNAKLKEFRDREKKMYGNMFEKFAQKDREWRFGWLDGEKPQVEIAPENPAILEERKKKREAKKRYLEETKRLLKEKREREERERLMLEQSGEVDKPTDEQTEQKNDNPLNNEDTESKSPISNESNPVEATCKY